MQKIFNLGRILLTVLLLIYLVSKINIRQSLKEMFAADPVFLLLSAMFFLLFILVSNWRWKILLDARKLYRSFFYLFRVYLSALFFNNIMPTAIGGDVVRVVYTANKTNRALAFSVALVDRIIGFIGLFFFALLVSFLILILKDKNHFLLLNLLGLITLLIIVLILFSNLTYRLSQRLFGKIRFWRIGERIDKVYWAMKEFTTKPYALLNSFLLSLLVQATIALTWFSLGLSIKGKVSVLYYFLYIPLIGLLTNIPISLGGLGIRENSFVGFFTALEPTRLTVEQAGSCALLYLVLNSVYALIGGLVFIALKKKIATETTEIKASVNPVSSVVTKEADDVGPTENQH